MKTNIQSVHFDADKKLIDFVEEKVSKLNAFNDRVISSNVTLRLDKAGDNNNKIAEIKLLVPGTDLFAKKQCSTFEEAIDLACDALKTQIKRHKEKQLVK
jgi:putative sigma-54 modulation protein